MTYCLSTPRDLARFDRRSERRSLSQDLFSQLTFAFASVAFIALAAICLLYARPGSTLQFAKGPALMPAAKPAMRVAIAPKAAGAQPAAPKAIAQQPAVALSDLTFALNYAPASLAQSAPRGTAFQALAPAVQTAMAPAETIVPVPMAPAVAELAQTVPLPAPRPAELTVATRTPVAAPRQMAARQTPAAALPSTPAETGSIFDRLFGGKSQQPSGTVLAYANPEDGALRTSPSVTSPAPAAPVGGYDRFTAIYDISARTVTLPNGTKLEAHSGLRDMLDDPRHVNVRMRGATPPATYDLKLRESLFHGVEALRLTPIDSNVYGRAGLLAHTYMLGPNGDSNGCVSFKNYDAFLQAYKRGEVKRLAVVARLN
jgi:hypothetical protein